MSSPLAALPAISISPGAAPPSDSTTDTPAPSASTKPGSPADFLGMLLLLLPGLNPTPTPPLADSNTSKSKVLSTTAPAPPDETAKAADQNTGVASPDVAKLSTIPNQANPIPLQSAVLPKTNLVPSAIPDSKVDAPETLVGMPEIPPAATEAMTIPTKMPVPTTQAPSLPVPIPEPTQGQPTTTSAVATSKTAQTSEHADVLPILDSHFSPSNPITVANVSPTSAVVNLAPALFVFADSKVSADPVAGSDKHVDEASTASAATGQTTDQPSHAALARHEEVKPTSVVDQIHETFRSHLDQLQQQGRVEVHLELHPPELGKMQVHLSLEDNHLSVRMVVQDENARRVLDQQMEPLRVRFNEMGVNLGQLDVRRDGGNANQEPPPEFNDHLTEPTTASGGRGRYVSTAQPTTLVDVMA